MRYVLLLALFILSACSSERSPSNPSPTTGGQSSGGPHYKVGTPYVIKGETYVPHEDFNYDETGIASWYGADFHGGKTANGEIFNKDELTAAHKTLPLPTLARVTNLENGKSIVVRINDRGPYSGARLIDMSQRAALLLGFEAQGTAKVRVQVLADESRAIAEAMNHYGASQATPAVYAENQSPQPLTMQQTIDTASLPPLEAANITPIKTTPAIHQQLMNTRPVAKVVQLPVTGSNQLYVQAGAFSVHENAIKLMHKLEQFGNTGITNVTVNGTVFYRVRVGPLQGVNSAERLLAQVKSSGSDGARIIVD